MISSTPSSGKRFLAGTSKTKKWYVRDFGREALRQLFGGRSSSRRTVYWSKDRYGNWVCHIPMYRGR